ncbi:MAG TPA: LamB/YcsF family protein, partial [Luteolibacter sp.]|nr:LamB/YcsF family protein [Luteolibacter sp.]
HPLLHHIKPHGALYHQANHSPAIAETLVKVMAELAPKAWLYAPPEGELVKAATQADVPFCSEGFIDRRYQQDGNLCQHHEDGAHIVNPCEATAQALGLALDQHVSTRNFKRIRLRVRSLCVHGDSPVALHTLRLARKALLRSWVTIAAPA